MAQYQKHPGPSPTLLSPGRIHHQDLLLILRAKHGRLRQQPNRGEPQPKLTARGFPLPRHSRTRPILTLKSGIFSPQNQSPLLWVPITRWHHASVGPIHGTSGQRNAFVGIAGTMGPSDNNLIGLIPGQARTRWLAHLCPVRLFSEGPYGERSMTCDGTLK